MLDNVQWFGTMRTAGSSGRFPGPTANIPGRHRINKFPSVAAHCPSYHDWFVAANEVLTGGRSPNMPLAAREQSVEVREDSAVVNIVS